MHKKHCLNFSSANNFAKIADFINPESVTVKKLLASVIVLFSFSDLANAKTAYVTDSVEIPLRSADSERSKIVKMLANGTQLTIFQDSNENGYSYVQASNGAEGFILTRYLSNEPSARTQLEAATKKLEALQEENKQLKSNHAVSQEIGKERDKLSSELAELHQTLNLQAASEYFIDEHFVELFKTQPLLTLKDNYVLVEMSYLNPPIPLHEYLFELQLAGYQPILAHPERYVYYHHNFNDYEKLKKMGCYFQVNLLSTVGYYGKDVAIAADKLLQADMINFAGSDIHHKQHIDSFKRKTVIKSNKQLEKVIENNQFFK